MSPKQLKSILTSMIRHIDGILDADSTLSLESRMSLTIARRELDLVLDEVHPL
jgi:hypothetical protein